MSQVATRLNEKLEYLYRKSPSLCQTVTQRYRSYQPLPVRSCPPEPASPKRKSKNHVQLRRQFTMLITAEEDPPPSLAEVSRQLGCGNSLLRKRHGDLCRQLRQRWDTYRQQRQARVEAELCHLVAALERPMPPVREVARQLGVEVTTLKQWLPELYAEVVRRHQASRQAERQRRQAYLDQIVSENSAPSPSLSQVAARLGCEPSLLQRRFPQQSRIIVDRYRVYRQQEYVTAQAALEAALSDTQHPPCCPSRSPANWVMKTPGICRPTFPTCAINLFNVMRPTGDK
jgi:AraC-like DNA-binding protein